MNCSDFVSRLDEYVDGELPPATATEIADHAATCPRCRAQLAALRRVRAAVSDLPKELTPARDLWAGIESRLHAPKPAASTNDTPSPAGTTRASTRRGVTAAGSRFSWLAQLAVAAALIVLASIAERQVEGRFGTSGWAVASVAGTPRVNSAPVGAASHLHPGEWLVTDGTSRAKVSVGEIGEVSVEPNSRLRVTRAAATDHRLELARGELNAFIWAPPRLFFVDTPSATAVDLGCAYSLKVDEAGGSELRVSSGYVALEYAGRESIIPAGWMCVTRPGFGPGTPFPVDAPGALREALARYDFEPTARGSALEHVLTVARKEDDITLWHLLGSTPRDARGAVFARLAQLRPPPAGVTLEGIVAGDRAMREAWATELGLQVSSTAPTAR